jgi:hypothetical protein
MTREREATLAPGSRRSSHRAGVDGEREEGRVGVTSNARVHGSSSDIGFAELTSLTSIGKSGALDSID